MGVRYPLAIVTTASITSLVRMTLYHHSISLYHARAEMDEDMAVLGAKARNAIAENPVLPLVSGIPGARKNREAGGTAPCGAAARSDNQGRPCVFDGPCSDSERKNPP